MTESITSLLLKENLKNLIPAIRGDWFLSDGALLGIERSGDLIPFDNDLDIYLLPGSSIDPDILESQGLKQQKYYMDTKVYNPKYVDNHLNTWREFCSYFQARHSDKKFNRAQILQLASKEYKLNKIKPAFTLPYIDVYHLTENLEVPYWNKFKYEEDEMQLEENFDLGFKIYLPSNRKKILKRLYGKNWLTPDTNFQHLNYDPPHIAETVL